MNRRSIDWENYEENFRKEWAKRDLEKAKSGSIAYIEKIDRLTSYPEQFHAHWETYLSPHNYWKNWREKVKSFQTEKEVDFYTDRLRAFMEFMEKYTRKDINRYCGRVIEGAKQWDPVDTPKLIEQELKRLENISEEEFNKTDEWKKSGGFRELSAEEMLNDKWFNKEIDKFFGLENGKLPKEQEKPVESNATQTQKPKENDLLISWVIGGGILAIIGLTTLFIITKRKHRLKRKN